MVNKKSKKTNFFESNNKKTKKSSSVETIVKKMNDIKLLKHQETAINQLVAKFPKQKGLLLFHHMGTGKTITALTLSKNFPNYKKVLIIPKEIKYVWEDNMKKLDISRKEFKFYYYKDLETIDLNSLKPLNNTLLIMDESHHIVNLLQDKERRMSLYNWLNSSTKILCLSGTPIYDEVTDIRYQINLCAGKQLLPVNEDLFRKKYYTSNPLKNFIFGWFLPIWKSPLSVITVLGVHMGLYLASIMGNLTGYITFLTFGGSIETLTSGGLAVAIPAMSWPLVLTIILFMLSKLLYHKIKNLRYLKIQKLINDIYPYVSYYKFNSGKIKEELDRAFPKQNYEIVPVDYNPKQINFWIKLTYGHSTAEELNMINVGKTIEESEIFGEIKDNNEYLDKGRIIGNLIFQDNDVFIFPPKFIRIISKITNNKYDIIQNKINSYFALIGKKNKLNMKLNKLVEKKHKPNYQDLVDNLNDRIKHIEMDIKLKKEKITARLNNNMKSAVIYSNFYEKGILLIATFLNYWDIPFNILQPNTKIDEKNKMLNDFKNSNLTNKNKIILLHPSFTEGISFMGARQLHIMEPLFKISKTEQLKARVVRYHSHIYLPMKDRNVEILQYYSSSEKFFTNAKKMYQKNKRWFKKEPHTLYFFRHKKFNQDMTPDNIILSKTNKVEKEVYKLSVALKTRNDLIDNLLVKRSKKKKKYKNKTRKQILQYLKDEECEIWLPNKDYIDEKNACYHLY